jgi:hypothetical protein
MDPHLEIFEVFLFAQLLSKFWRGMGPYLLLFALFFRADNPYSHDNVGH